MLFPAHSLRLAWFILLWVSLIGVEGCPSAADAAPFQSGQVQEVTYGSPDFSRVTGFTHFVADLDPYKGEWPAEEKDRLPFMRVHFDRIKDESKANYDVLIINSRKEVVAQYSKLFFKGKSPEFWSEIFREPWLRVVVQAEVPPNGLSFRIDKLVMPVTEGAFKSFVGKDDTEDIYQYYRDRAIYKIAKSIGIIHYVTQGEPRDCSGFLYGLDLFLTNYHCITTDFECRSATIEFGYEYVDKDLRLQQMETFDCLGIERSSSQALDFAAIRLNRQAGVRWGTLVLSDKPPCDSQGWPLGCRGTGEIFIIHHPGARPKKISKVNCRVTTSVFSRVSEESADFGHICDTEDGSSGAPIIGLGSGGYEVIGLHYDGHKEGPCDFSTNQKCENRAKKISEIQSRLR